MDHYILVGKEVIPYEVETLEEMCLRDENGMPHPCPKLMKIGEWAEDIANRVIQHTQVGDVFISTVFLWMDHGFHFGKKPKNYQPVVFETMAWNKQSPDGFIQFDETCPVHLTYPEVDEFNRRGRTFDEAVAWHEQCVGSAILHFQVHHGVFPSVTVLQAHQERMKDLGIDACPHVLHAQVVGQ